MKNKTNTTPVVETQEEILMPDGYKKVLKEMYLLRSYSGFEEPLRNYIMAVLTELKIPFINYNGNILGFNHPGAPLFSAHMDMVNTDSYRLHGMSQTLDDGYVFTVDKKTNIRLYRDKEQKVQTSLGADDKNGVWVILMMLFEGYNINFAFCHSEEVGGTGSSQIVADAEYKKFISECKYGIIIDRRNSGDIIGYSNKYCLTLDDHIQTFAKERDYKYTCTRGSISDADRFSEYIECVNLSCGYYEPHTSREYTNLNELYNTLQFCKDIVDHLNYRSASTARVREFKGLSTYTGTTSTASSSYWDKYKGYSYKDDDDASTVKKKLGKKKTTTSMTTTSQQSGGLGTTSKCTCIKSADMARMLDRFDVDPDAVYVEDTGAFLIPLYGETGLQDTGTLFDCKIEWVYTCTNTNCEEFIYVLKASLDSLWELGYDINKDKLYGICTECGTTYDLTKDAKTYPGL